MNYQKVTDEIISSLDGRTPRLLLHACCAPCSTYVLEYLAEYFEITVLYYNPNIYPSDEYDKRLGELKKLILTLKARNPISLISLSHTPEKFYEKVQGLENEPEGGKRCPICFMLRLEESAKAALDGGFDYFTTTLSVSPHKNAETLNSIGKSVGERYGVPYLYSDFKKRGGYQRSIELSKEYELYRQDYCGCEYSLNRSRD
jgi:Uncharacterized protein conserved in bacteria